MAAYFIPTSLTNKKSFMTLTTGFGMTGKACTSGGSDGTLTDTGF
jgi:hypothetical protein